MSETFTVNYSADYNPAKLPTPPDGCYTATCDIRFRPQTENSRTYILVILEWTLNEASTEEGQKWVGSTVTDFFNLLPNDNPKFENAARKFARLKKVFKLPDLSFSTGDAATIMAPVVAILGGTQATIELKTRAGKDGREHQNIEYMSASDGVGANGLT